VLETIARRQIRDCRRVDIKRKILNCGQLKAHFEENPADLKVLKHDEFLLPSKVQKSLRFLPDYLGQQVKRQQHPLTQKIREVNLDGAQT
jgi:ATP-dependent RNA helicase DDX56/DBP9